MFQFTALPQINIDLSYFTKLASQPTGYAMLKLFLDGGWLILLPIIIWGGWEIWMFESQKKFARKLKWILLAIDVPKETEQSPKAVEQIFAHLTGGYRGLVKKELYLEGQTQFYFSLEIVSINGYLQFFIWTVDKLRDLVESAIYSQYPDAEISEVPDYTTSIPREWPNDKVDLWGTEYILSKKWAYPIRTWMQFEHTLSAELKDPLSVLLEAFSKLKKGEQVWIQIIITPTLDTWREEGEKIINKLLGRKAEGKKPGLLAKTLEFPVQFATEFAERALSGPPGEMSRKEDRDDSHLKMLGMTKGERDVIESIQMKIARPGFKTKIRFCYLGEPGVFVKGPRIALMNGSMKQFASLAGNSFKTYGKITPKSDYFWQRHKIFEYLSMGFYVTKRTKQRRLIAAYRARSNWRGAPSYILNIEELATIFHFPVRTVKAPLLKKTEAKRAEPPFTLPVMPYQDQAEVKPAQKQSKNYATPYTAPKDSGVEKKAGPPGNLPIV